MYLLHMADDNQPITSPEPLSAFKANRMQERPIVPFPKGVSLRTGSPRTMFDSEYGRGYHEFQITNESLSGIHERANLVKGQVGEVGSFACVGSPIKTVLQATILQPNENLAFVDISGKNTWDAALLAASLRSGMTSIYQYIQTPEGKEVLQVLDKIFPDRFEYKYSPQEGNEYVIHTERINKSIDSIHTQDRDLKEGMALMGISEQEVLDAVSSVKNIGIHLDSIRSEDMLLQLLESAQEGAVIIDASNIPLSANALEVANKDTIIFFGFHGTQKSSEYVGVPDFGHVITRNGINFWNYPLNDSRTKEKHLNGGMTVGSGYYRQSYKQISRYVDDAASQW